MKKDKETKIVNFIADFEYVVAQLEKYSGYLRLGEKSNEVRGEALEILKKKARKMKKAEDIDDLKKYIKVKKLLEKDGNKKI